MTPRRRRSRALWDAARAPGASRLAVVRAVLYEIQPVRFDEIDFSSAASRLWTGASATGTFLFQAIPPAAAWLWGFARSRSRAELASAAGVLAYWQGVRYVHRALDAGPMVVILTALAAIFTVGLGDGGSGGGSGGGVSAYSVFNRGFQRIMGSVDVESLVAQHVGGGLAAQALQMQREAEDDRGGNGEVGRRGGGRAAAAAAAGGGAAVAAANGDADDRQRQEGQNRVRRTGKKARRRRNLEIRREMQRQRQAAAAMGFAGDGGEAEIAAMNRLFDDQAGEFAVQANNDETLDEEWENGIQDEGFQG